MALKDEKIAGEEKGFGIVHQYVKDLSFENLLSASNMMNSEFQPNGEISLSVNSIHVQDSVHEVIVKIKVDAKGENDNKEIYIAEIEYGAMVQVEGFDEDDTNGILMVEAPRLMFPYIRNTIAEITREGGFVPLVMAPVDFLGIFMENVNSETPEKSDA